MNCQRRRASTALSFGIGMFVASVMPIHWVLVISSITIIVVSISCRR